MAAIGSILVNLPSTSLKPAGAFIQALAVTTKIPEKIPLTATMIPESQCRNGDRRFQPYRYTPIKMASVKNAKPSREKGRPMIAPAFSMKPGQSKPSSKDNTVPDTELG